MIFSMTAFSRLQQQGDFGILTCEMRSINHRYLELSIYLPEALSSLEMMLREIIRTHIKRGKIDCNLRYRATASGQSSSFQVNAPLVTALSAASEEVKLLFRNVEAASATDILRYPGVLETQQLDTDVIKPEIQKLVAQTTQDLIKVRAREGEVLKQLFIDRLNDMETELKKITVRLPEVSQEQQNRILKRFADVKIELDPARLEQEMVMFVQRIDIVEEIDRTRTHIGEIRRILDVGGTVGRRLDFLLQELNREANTIASKSVDSTITHAAVEMKVLIEQIREQVQNVE